MVPSDRQTRKYANLMAEPRVARFIDNRTSIPAYTREAVAVTVLGQAAEALPDDKEKFLPLFLDRHFLLKDFTTSPTCASIAVRVSTYVVVQRFGEVQELKVI